MHISDFTWKLSTATYFTYWYSTVKWLTWILKLIGKATGTGKNLFVIESVNLLQLWSRYGYIAICGGL